MAEEDKKNEAKAEETNATTSSEGTSLDSDSAAVADANKVIANQDNKPAKKPPLKRLMGYLNIYIILFLVILAIAGAVLFASYAASKKETQQNTETKTLTTEQLEQLQNTATKIGDPKQILNVESNAIFSGKVLVRDSLDVAGTIKVGGNLSLPGITVSGNSNFDQVQINNLNISGNTAILGQLSVQRGLTVSGPANFGGVISAPALNVETLQLSGDLVLNRHINPNGPNPGKTNGSALGNGGTSSVSGNDTAGTVTINTGTSTAAGCFINVSFAQAFSATPHVVASPVGASAGNVNYYINRSASGFSICTTNAAPAQTTFFYDYIVLD